MWPVEPLKTDKQTNRQADRQADRQTAVTNILFENRRFRKVMKAARRAGTLRNRWNCNFKNRDDNVMRAADDKIGADDDLMRISNFSKLKKELYSSASWLLSSLHEQLALTEHETKRVKRHHLPQWVYNFWINKVIFGYLSIKNIA